jgi:hypothetical protein
LKSKPYLILLLLFGFLFINCPSPYLYHYNSDYSLISPQSNAPESLEYSDSIVSVLFDINSDNAYIGFDMYNKLDKPIKINWDDVSYVGPSGKANRVIHNGVRYIEKDAPQAPSLIPPKTKIQESITPVGLIYWSVNQWFINPLFYGYEKQGIKNKEISIYLPLEIEKEIKAYMFTFKINNVTELSDTSLKGQRGCLGPW